MATPHIADLIALAVRLVNAKQPERARIVCEQAVASWPAHPAVHQMLAVLDIQAGQPARAREHAALSLKLRPDHVPTLLVLGDAALAQRELAAASEALERAVALAPDQADAWFKVSLVRQDLRDLDGAVAALERVLASNPDRSTPWSTSASCCRRPAGSTRPCAPTGARTACARRRSAASRTRWRRRAWGGYGWIWTTCAPSCAPCPTDYRAGPQRKSTSADGAWPGGGGATTC